MPSRVTRQEIKQKVDELAREYHDTRDAEIPQQILELARRQNRFGWPLRGIIWFTVAIIGSCAIIGLLAGYEQTARSLEKVSHRVPQ